MKYFLVEVKKAFGIYPMKAQITMREKLVNGIFKNYVKVIKELSAEEVEGLYKTEVKYRVEKNDSKETSENDAQDVENNEDIQTPTEDVKDETEDTQDVENVESENTPDSSEDETPKSEENDAQDEVELEDMETAALLELANTKYNLNKPTNTGRANLIASIKAAR